MGRENERSVAGARERGREGAQRGAEIVEAAGTGRRIPKNAEQKHRRLVEAAGVEPEKR